MFNRFKAKREVSRQKHEKNEIAGQLRQAALFGRLDQTMELVAKYGDDPEVMNAQQKNKHTGGKSSLGPTPLIIAARQGHEEIVRALLKAKCIDVNAVDQHAPVIESLISGIHSVHPTSPDFYHNTALLAAITAKRAAVANVLAARPDVNINAVSYSGKTALISAVEYCPAVVPALLKVNGVDVNAKDKQLCTALHWACLRRNTYQEGVPEYITNLLKMPGIDVNAADEKGWTPLMYAAKRGDRSVIYTLLAAGADTSLTNHVHANAAQIAELHGHGAMAHLLRPRERVGMKI